MPHPNCSVHNACNSFKSCQIGSLWYVIVSRPVGTAYILLKSVLNSNVSCIDIQYLHVFGVASCFSVDC